MPRRLSPALTALVAVPLLAAAYQVPAQDSATASAAPRCAGVRATIVVRSRSPHVVRGTRHRDVIVVTAPGHVVLAGAGDDLICGSSGRDVIDGGPGNDQVYAGAGDDRVTGGTGNDVLSGGRGTDVVDGGPGADRIDVGTHDRVTADPRDRDRRTGDDGAWPRPSQPSPQAQPSPSPDPSPAASPSAAPSDASGPSASRTTGCLASPHLCGFPDATNTGYAPTGVTLTPYTGPLTITKAGTVIDGKLISGQLRIAADNVTVRRSKVVWPHADCHGDCWAVVIGSDSGTVVEDVEVDGNGGTCYVGVLGGGANVVRRVNVHGCGDYFRPDAGLTIEDSYGHDEWRGAFDGRCVDQTHNDGVQDTGHSHVTLRHNTLVLPTNYVGCPGAEVNNVVTISSEDGPPSDVVIDHNLLDGGGWAIRLAPSATNVRITDNQFGRHSEYGVFQDEGGQYTASGNIWDDTGASPALW